MATISDSSAALGPGATGCSTRGGPSHTVTISSLIIPVGVEAAYVSYTRRANVPTECRHDEVQSSSTAVVLWSVWRCTLRSAMRGCAVAWWSGCRRARARRQLVLSLRSLCSGSTTTRGSSRRRRRWPAVGGRWWSLGVWSRLPGTFAAWRAVWSARHTHHTRAHVLEVSRESGPPRAAGNTEIVYLRRVTRF